MTTVYVIRCDEYDYSESHTKIIGVYTDREAAEVFAAEYNARPTQYDIITQKVNEFGKTLKVDGGPYPVFSLEKPEFDKNFAYDDIYKNLHQMRMKDYKNKRKTFEKTEVASYLNKKKHLYNQAINDYRNALYNDESLKVGTRETNTTMIVESFELETSP